MRIAGRLAAWVLGVPLVLAVLLYLILLVTPIPLPLVNSQVRNLVMASMPAGSQIELGDMALALERGIAPVIRFRPVVYTDTISGARVHIDALEVGFSPLRALWGQPGATITIVGPHIQINQDLFGPRLVSFNIVPAATAGGRPTVQIIEGAAAFPEVGISADGVDVRGRLPSSALPMRSDNDWLIYNLEAAGSSIAGIVEQAAAGRFSRLVIRDGTLDMNDALYGLFRTFNDINLDISPTPDGKAVAGQFSAEFGGTVMNGSLERVVEDDGSARLKASVTNIDLASFLPFINDPEAMMAVVGTSALSIDVGFDATGKVRGGLFHIDLTGTDLRIEDRYFPIATSIAKVRWDPEAGAFSMAKSQISIGGSSAHVQGLFKLGLDERYGPTLSISAQAEAVSIHSELGAPETPFSKMSFRGWSAPLYGALGIDQFRASKDDGSRLAGTGRIDMLQQGMGLDLTIAGEGITADDLKRLWPYFIASESRDWFVRNVVAGRIKASTMHYAFAPGTLATGGEEKPIPENSVTIDIAGTGVEIIPIDGMAPIALDGETRLQVRDSRVTVAAEGGTVTTENGAIAVANAGVVMGSDNPDERLIEISGDVTARIPALVALAREQQPGLLAPEALPIDVDALGGDLSLALVSTIVLDKEGATKRLDYAANGVVKDFGSTAPLDSHTISDGQLSFIASQAGYRIAGQAEVDGLPADVVIEGELTEGAPPPSMLLSATLDADDFKQMGFDVSEFIDGTIKFVAKPMPDDSLQMAVDLTNAAVTLRDVGISKAAGVPGTLRAAVRQGDGSTELSQIEVGFGDVRLEGSLSFDNEAGLQSADFTTFALSPGDSAEMSLAKVDGGYEVRLRGEQLDLKPMFKRFFGLGEAGSTGGPAATSVSQTIAVDAELKRALGYFKTTAFNVDLDMALRGTNLRRADLQAQFGGGSSISVTTNPTPDGKSMSVAFNDLGTVLRMIGVYPNIEGGEGSLVLETFTEEALDRGKFTLGPFAIVDEDNVAQILGNHEQSRQLISSRNKLEFSSGEADFIRRSDRVEITEAILAGDSVGGTARGFIYTDTRQYDIAGTYVPLFGLNNVFQKLPILGPLLGGREGEGLFGVTFAIRGPLSKPDFQINPVSVLVPGVLRRMFEYRAREQPRAQ